MVEKKQEHNNTIEILPFSEKQSQFLNNELNRYNILEGSVRSGKTVVSVVKFIKTLIENHKPGDELINCLICGNSIGAIKRNVFPIFTGFLNTYSGLRFDFNHQFNYIILLNYRIHLIGFNTILTSKAILGSTIFMVYCDEINLCEEKGFDTILDRMSLPGSALIGSCNPSAPSHWIYERFIDREDVKPMLNYYRFVLGDNIHLEEGYVDSLKRRYPKGTANYLTKILGLRAAEQNSIYGDYLREDTFTTDYALDGVYCIGIDIGFTSKTVLSFQNIIVDTATRKISKAVVFDEIVLDGMKDQITTSMIVNHIAALVEPVNRNLGVPVGVCVPHDGVALYNELKQRRDLDIVLILHKPDSIEAIEEIRQYFHTGTLKISTNCAEHHDSIYSYSWKFNSNGEVVIDKASNDHAVDSMRMVLVSDVAFRTKNKIKELSNANKTIKYDENNWNGFQPKIRQRFKWSRAV